MSGSFFEKVLFLLPKKGGSLSRDFMSLASRFSNLNAWKVDPPSEQMLPNERVGWKEF